MKYPRPPYGSPEIPVEKKRLPLTYIDMDFPKIDYPITPLENFKLAAACKTPMWVPDSIMDFQSFFSQDLGLGRQQGPDYDHMDEDYTFTDLFDIQWTWVKVAGGPMLTPGTQFMDDITKWERDVKWPDLTEWDWDTPAKNFMENQYDPTKVMHINIGQGPTERLVTLLGGYEESMISLVTEPEAVKDFFDAFAEFTIKFFDNLYSRYPINKITLHDDWGTERDTFFSEKMMEDLVYKSMKTIIDHIKSKDIVFQLHTCGRIERFIPHMIDMGVDFMQIQTRANDILKYKEKFGDKIGFNNYGILGVERGGEVPKEEFFEKIRKTVEVLGKHGGYYTSAIVPSNPELTWDGTWELYSYSREFYDRERGDS